MMKKMKREKRKIFRFVVLMSLCVDFYGIWYILSGARRSFRLFGGRLLRRGLLERSPTLLLVSQLRSNHSRSCCLKQGDLYQKE